MIEIENLVKLYGPVQALAGVSIRVEAGALGLLGPNGAGKSTLIKALLGLVQPTSGSVRFLGLDVRRERHRIRSRVGYMPEDEAMFPGLDGIDAVTFAGQLAGLSGRAALQRAHEVLDYVGLGEERYREVSGYSTGMKQRLRFAQAIVHDPEVILLDEPTNGMDPAGRREMLDLVTNLCHTHGKGLILSSHLLPDVERVCEQVAILGKGKIRVHDSIEELSRVENPFFHVRVGGETEAFESVLQRSHADCTPEEESGHYRVRIEGGGEEICRAAAEAGCELRGFSRGKTSLEEIYLRTVEESR